MSPARPTLPLPESLPAGACRLTDWGVIRAQGEDARKFLHGQLTQDIEHLAAGQARLAGYCSAKGRLLATFVIWPAAGDELLLACSADLLPAVLKRLNMFVLRAKCRLSDASADWPLWGVAGTGAVPELAPAAAWTQQRQAEAHCVALPPARLGPVEVPRWLWAGPTPPAAADLPAGIWAALEALSGTPRVMAATSEQFVPQMVNLDLVEGVNFKKGCYPGQEVVARSQYRGTLKRRGAILLGTATMHPGQEIVHSADPGQPAGLVALAGDGPGLGPVAFAELKLAALEGGSLHLGTAEGPLLRIGELPYPVPTEPA
ncbi:MAG: folate-binding protein YgfZ [Rubrivivax sp.]|nr:folate-binding protein YgfZ [Rubrivivax sp.]